MHEDSSNTDHRVFNVGCYPGLVKYIYPLRNDCSDGDPGLNALGVER